MTVGLDRGMHSTEDVRECMIREYKAELLLPRSAFSFGRPQNQFSGSASGLEMANSGPTGPIHRMDRACKLL